MNASGGPPTRMPHVRFGIVILADQPWAQAARQWRLAEEYGFGHAWTYDHLGWRTLVDGYWPRPDGPYAGHEAVLEAVAAGLVSRCEGRGEAC